MTEQQRRWGCSKDIKRADVLLGTSGLGVDLNEDDRSALRCFQHLRRSNRESNRESVSKTANMTTQVWRNTTANAYLNLQTSNVLCLHPGHKQVNSLLLKSVGVPLGIKSCNKVREGFTKVLDLQSLFISTYMGSDWES